MGWRVGEWKWRTWRRMSQVFSPEGAFRIPGRYDLDKQRTLGSSSQNRSGLKLAPVPEGWGEGSGLVQFQRTTSDRPRSLKWIFTEGWRVMKRIMF